MGRRRERSYYEMEQRNMGIGCLLFLIFAIVMWFIISDWIAQPPPSDNARPTATLTR